MIVRIFLAPLRALYPITRPANDDDFVTALSARKVKLSQIRDRQHRIRTVRELAIRAIELKYSALAAARVLH